MKFSKIIAAAASLSMIAAMAIPASAGSSEDYLYTVQGSWNGNAPADLVEGPVKWQYDDEGNPVLKKGAADLNKWDSGKGKFNGNWVQVLLTDTDLSALTIDFTVELDEESLVEFHADDPETPEDNIYIVLNVFANDGLIQNDCPHAEINDSLGEQEEGTFVNTGAHTFTYTVTGDQIAAAVEAGGAQLNENEDGTATLGFNIQVGHFTFAKVTGLVKSSTGNIYDGASQGGDESSQAGGESSKAADDSSKAADSSKADASSKADDTTKSTTTTTTTTTTTGGTTAAAAGGSDATDGAAATGATAGLVFAGLALAGAAVVASKRK